MHTHTSPRVLLVEDDTACGSLLQACVRSANGIPIGPARTADQALALYANEKPDLVLLDVELEGQTDGVTLANQLRQQNPHLPLLFITGATDDDTYHRAQQLQPVMFVLKPFNPIAVKRMVETVLLQMTVTAQANAIIESSKSIAFQLTTSIARPSTANNLAWRMPTALMPTGKEWIFVREHGRLMRLTVENIVSVQTDSKYCVLTMKSGQRHSVRTPLFELLDQLQPADFLRVHRSWLINLAYIETIALAESIVFLSGGIEVPLGRVYRDELMYRVRLVE